MADDDTPLSMAEADGAKAALDTEELSVQGGASSPEDKVELDLEDAPFLEDDDEEEAEEQSPAPISIAPPKKTEPSGEAVESPLRKLLRNRKVLMGAGGGFALLLILILWLAIPSSQPTPTPQPTIITPEQAMQAEPQPPAPPSFTVAWEPFWVELKDTEGNIRFLVCKFATSTENEKLAWEAGAEKLVLRDAIFYYLRNKDLAFLSDMKRVEELKTNVLAVINQYMDNGQFTDLLIENYLVK